LLSTNWRVDSADAFEAHYGSEAIAQATTSFDFIDVLPLVAPWRWLDTAVVRGSQLLELRAFAAPKIVLDDDVEDAVGPALTTQVAPQASLF
jgi:hypothetical protein